MVSVHVIWGAFLFLFLFHFNKTVIPPAVVVYDMTISNSFLAHLVGFLPPYTQCELVEELLIRCMAENYRACTSECCAGAMTAPSQM